MTDMDEALLAQYRRSIQPAEADKLRVRSAVTSALAARTDGTSNHDSASFEERSWGSTRFVSRWYFVAAFGAAGFAIGFVSGRWSVTGAAPAVLGTPALSVSSLPELLRTAPAIATVTPHAAPSSDAAPVRSRSARSAASVSVRDTGLSLGDQARELQRVDRALRRGESLLALGILADLDERAPGGPLQEERQAARLMGECQSGAHRADDVNRWLEAHPNSVYRARLLASCKLEAAPTDSPGPDTESFRR